MYLIWLLLDYTEMQVGFSTGWINTVTTLPTETGKLQTHPQAPDHLDKLSNAQTHIADTHTRNEEALQTCTAHLEEALPERLQCVCPLTAVLLAVSFISCLHYLLPM